MPFADQPASVVAALAYLGVVLAIGLWAARRTTTARDFFIAGQGVGLVVTTLAATSAGFSGFLFLGGPGLTYRLGLAALFIVVPVSFTGGLLCWTVAARLRRLAGEHEVYTVADAVSVRFGGRAAGGAAAVAVLLGTIAYLGAQLRALGILLEAVFGTSLALGMVAGTAVVLAYAVAGGMLAGVYTDLAQGLLMVVAAGAVFARALSASGGWAGITGSIAGSDLFGERFLDPLGGVPAATAIGFFFVFGIGVLGQPHVVHKFFMLDDPAKLRWLPLSLGVSQTLCVLVWLGIGLAVPALVAQGRLAPLVDPDQAAPVFLLEVASPVLAGLVFAGILAAVMSTADSFTNIGAAALVRDLPRAAGRRVGDELSWGRWASVVLTLAAAVVAYLYDDLVALLGTLAFGTFAAGLAPTLAVGLAWRRVGAAAATASIVTGTALNLGLELLGRQSVVPDPLPPGVLPSAVALSASFVVLFAVAWLRPARQDG